ncbi:hypothetical protein CVT26_000926 [Gymnopilus dilepis]|uniref:NADP-dependent oxidoreductase domain-containing protein n=1 Tax=Gymnopilus dilepis TaxID=231916 RepID=A0A409VI74_9AGAR|nr:hypothetical protein CVT26_000926 [Gymnopilus dilepis]
MKPATQQRPPVFYALAIFVVPIMAVFLSKNLSTVRLAAVKQEIFQRLGFAGSRSLSTVQHGRLPTHFSLPSGDKIPSIALGVWKASPGDVKGAVKAALEAGYRHIDEAWAYGNEAEVGEVIKASGIPRKDIWLTSKLWNDHHAPEDVEPALDDSLTKLGTDYLDLYLIHWPVAFGKDGKLDVKLTEDPYPTWQKLEEMVEKGKVRNIGVANFNIRRLEELLARPLKIKPAVNQYEINYWNPEPELLRWCKDHGILVESYSPLGSSQKVKETLQLPEAWLFNRLHDCNTDLIDLTLAGHQHRSGNWPYSCSGHYLLAHSTRNRRFTKECHPDTRQRELQRFSTTMGVIYHEVPTDVDETKDLYHSFHFDNEVGQAATDQQLPAGTRQRRPTKFRFLTVSILFCMAYFVFRGVVGSNGVAGLRRKCSELMGHPGALGSHGVYRNLTTAKSGQLPTHYTLPSGDKIPSVALGVWRASPGEVGRAVKAALKVGYRHIDGAWIYGNEVEVGDAIKSSKIPREQLWLTSKLWNSFHHPDDVEQALDESLARLGTNYLDLYLIHWPVAFKPNTSMEVDRELTENPYPTWQKLEQLVEKGKIRNIGVSNFNIRRLQNLTANPLKIRPAINQVELSYWNPQPELLKWSKENGILLEAYSPLGSQEKVKESLEVPEVKKIAKELGLTPAQVYISWHVQRGAVALPKSVHPDRVEENFKVAALPKDAFELLEKVATSHPPVRTVDPSKRWGVDIWN